jgi:ferredoxin
MDFAPLLQLLISGNQGDSAMGLEIDALKCIGCMACELACGYHRDDAFALLSSCIVPYRGLEKKNYMGVILKEEDSLVAARPEGTEINRIGEQQDSGKEADASAKPLLLRESCDLCEDLEQGPLCIRFCPVNAIALAA